jgi:hypothetical protein
MLRTTRLRPGSDFFLSDKFFFGLVCEKDFGKGIFFHKFSVFGKKKKEKKKRAKIMFLI